MSDELEAIRKRYDAIIPGPWEWFGNTATDQVMLATKDRGRLFILMPGKYTTEYVYDHYHVESYTLEQARERVIPLWCPMHREDHDWDDPGRCMCDELREFLAGELDPEEGHRDFSEEDRGYKVDLTRGVKVHEDLRFPVAFAGHGMEAEDHCKVHGGVMRSYRQGMPRYEVLGYRTEQEWVMDQGGVIPNASGSMRDVLYREDFMGLANPNADFIAHAPEDVGFLLGEVDRLTRLLAFWGKQPTHPGPGENVMGTEHDD